MRDTDSSRLGLNQHPSLIISGAILLLQLASVAVAVQRIDEIPSPRPHGWVTDLTGRLAATDIEQINALVDHAHEQTGAELAVVVVDTIGGQGHRGFATDLFNLWGIGDAERNDGVLLFVALDDRAAELILGDGIDGPGATRIADSIMQGTMVPALRAGQPGHAMLGGARAALERIVFPSLDPDGGEAPDAPLPAAPSPDGRAVAVYPDERPWWERLIGWARQSMDAAIGAAGAGLIALWVGIRRILRHRPRRCDHCRQRMLRLEEDADDAHLSRSERKEERLQSADWDVWLCPGCDRVKKIQYKAFFSHYSRCPDCGARTMSKNEKTVRSASEHSTGLARITEYCEHCNHRSTYTRTIPRVSRSSSSSSSGFGGGRSSGGGSSGRW